jgi:glucokinase
MSEYSIGVDLGGTNLRAAAITREGKLMEKVAGTTDLKAGRERVLADITGFIDQLRQRHGHDKLAGVGVGIPGFIHIKNGFIVGSNNLAVLENHPVRDDIEKRLGCKVILENDANAAALGESWIGAGQDVDDLVLLTLGTGIGGGIISGGRILHGSEGMAAELGHITISPNGNPCGCGNTGCVEKHASATAIAAMARLLLGKDLTSLDVFNLAKEGNERALMIFRHMGEALGIAIANLVNIFNFPLYLLSGGPLPAWDFFAPTMLAEINRRSFTFRNSPTRVERATLGNEAGLYGAAYLPFLSGRKEVPHNA